MVFLRFMWEDVKESGNAGSVALDFSMLEPR
jgi:hypothetical protein